MENASGGILTRVVDLRSLFQNYRPFAVDATHPTGGCAFTLTLPFVIDGDPRAIARVDVTLQNAVGLSPTATARLQQ